VDIIQPLHDNVSNESVDRSIVQDVVVTAVGTRPLVGQDPQAGHSVTLLVTPRQAQLIDLASSDGRPRLLLRNARDVGTDAPPPVALSDLMGSHFVRTTYPTGGQPAVVQNQSVDPFAPTTRPAIASAPQWSVRVVTAGAPAIVNLNLPHATEPSTVTDINEGGQ
jgi:Flp pilus assembly protein CpaB